MPVPSPFFLTAKRALAASFEVLFDAGIYSDSERFERITIDRTKESYIVELLKSPEGSFRIELPRDRETKRYEVALGYLNEDGTLWTPPKSDPLMPTWEEEQAARFAFECEERDRADQADQDAAEAFFKANPDIVPPQPAWMREDEDFGG